MEDYVTLNLFICTSAPRSMPALHCVLVHSSLHCQRGTLITVPFPSLPGIPVSAERIISVAHSGRYVLVAKTLLILPEDLSEAYLHKEIDYWGSLAPPTEPRSAQADSAYTKPSILQAKLLSVRSACYITYAVRVGE